jgi:hypothetical protein
MMRKGFVVALAVTGSLVMGPAALAATAEPSGALPGLYTPQHAGHDHGKKPEKPKKDGKKGTKKGGKKYSKKSYGEFHDHGHGHSHDHDSAHAGGGYDAHRSHPRQQSAPIGLATASGDVLEHGEEPVQDDHDHDGDGKPDHDPEDHDKDEKPKPKPKPGS